MLTGDVKSPFIYLLSFFVSIPGFEGGSSGDTVSPAPSSPASPTPSLPPHQEVAPAPGKSPTSTTTATQTFAYCVHSLSSKTCLELLTNNVVTDEQLIFEFDYLKTLGSAFDIGKTKFKAAAVNRGLSKYHTAQASADFSSTVQKLNDLNYSISCLVERAQKEVTRLRQPASPSPVSPPHLLDDSCFSEPFSPVQPPSPTSNIPEVTFTDKVCRLIESIDFRDLSVPDILSELDVSDLGNCGRKTSYYGNQPYAYGRLHHRAQPFPGGGVFDKIFTRMFSLDPRFTRERFTCLVTLYDNGSCYIPSHSDDEPSISPGSEIYTISVGSPRVLRFLNREGPVQESLVNLPHGSLYAMSQSSQATWTHGIERDPNIFAPRISFTFRELQTLPNRPEKKQVPPIHEPEPVKPFINAGTHRRILFLSDSILRHTPDHIFSGRLPHYRVVKKTNFELSDVFGFEPEFKYSDIVVISSGINDLARYGKRAHVLADLVTKRLSACCLQNPHTTFIFSALLHTKFAWLNKACSDFNDMMFELATSVPNLSFFDAHEVLTSAISSAPLPFRVINPDDDGIHITFKARRVVTDQLANGVEYIASKREGVQISRLQGWHWPLRAQYRHKFHHLVASSCFSSSGFSAG